MRFLLPDQIACWYRQSLARSGFGELYAFSRDFWKDLVRRGSHAVPPGFVARFMERYLSVPVGEKIAIESTNPLEDEYLEKIFSTEGADRLEGVFLLSGSDRDPILAQGIFQQMIERLPSFKNEKIVFSDSDLEKSFSAVSAASAGFDIDAALEETYKSALEEFSRVDFRFYADDIFEISHPALFERAADRFFFRRMTRAMKGMSFWTRSVFTLKEESSWVVARYGEPQTLPLGGYDELTNKGTLSSLVTSELAYIDENMDFDLFDYKFLENQLTYFKRDSGAVFRIRRDIVIRVSMTEFFENERHLGLLFAWCFNFAEKLIEVFLKDMVDVLIIVEGYKPSSLKDACEFFSHFLAEKGLGKRVKLLSEPDIKSVQSCLRENAQTWVFAAKNMSVGKFLPVEFPQSDEFAAMAPNDQEKHLGSLINQSIERMVKNADSQI